MKQNGYLLLNGNRDIFPEATIQCAVFKGVVTDIFIPASNEPSGCLQTFGDCREGQIPRSLLRYKFDAPSACCGVFDELPVKTIRETIGTILNLISSNSKIKQKEIQVKTGLSLSTVKRIMSALQQDGEIERKGNNRSGEWITKENIYFKRLMEYENI